MAEHGRAREEPLTATWLVASDTAPRAAAALPDTAALCAGLGVIVAQEALLAHLQARAHPQDRISPEELSLIIATRVVLRVRAAAAG